MTIATFVRSLGIVSTLLGVAGLSHADKFGKPTGPDAFAGDGGVAGAGAGCACPGDVDGNGAVNAADLSILLGQWGASGSGDLDGSGVVNAADLSILLGAWGLCVTAPANDLCVDAQPIGVGSYEFCTTTASTDGPAYSQGSPCAQFGYNQIYHDVWYSFAAIGDGTLTVETCGTSWDTRLAVYGAALPGIGGCPSSGISLVGLLACDDDSCGVQSKVTLQVKAGHIYKIRVGGFAGFSGTGTLTVGFQSVGQQCFNAVPVTAWQNTTVFGTTLDNASGTDESPCGSGDTVGEWYSFENTCPNENAKITISTCTPATDFDTVLAVFKQTMNGCNGQITACVDDTQLSICELNGNFRKSQVTFTMSPGAIYFVRVAGYNGQRGNFGLSFLAEDCN